MREREREREREIEREREREREIDRYREREREREIRLATLATQAGHHRGGRGEADHGAQGELLKDTNK